MLEIFANDFARDAFLASVFISISCGLIGTLVVINRFVGMAGSITHGAYGGLGCAVFFSLPLLPSAMVFTIFLAFLMAYLTKKYPQSSDSVIGVIWAFGMSVGITMIDLSSQKATELLGFLFGSIFLVSKEEMFLIGFFAFLFLFCCMIFYKQFCAISFDSDFAKLRGVNTTFFYYLLIALISICIVISIRVVGLILVIALFCIPSFIASSYFKRLGSIMAFSVFLNILFCFLGIFISYEYNLSGGACIILVASCVFFLNFFALKFIKLIKEN